jgi:N6-adenosine-specific RNA methylase IME4
MPPKPAFITVDGQARDLAQTPAAQVDAWRAACLAKLPASKKYQVVYADPPWTYRDNGAVEGKPTYPTMSLDDLKSLPVRAMCAPTCVLFMWATNPLLPQALEVIKAWGFEYKTVFKVWLKRSVADNTPLCGVGWWTRPSTELVLVATRGSGYMKWKRTHSEPQEFASRRSTTHSRKPPEIRDSIANFFDVQHRIELFARDADLRFDAWGLEVPGYFAAAA